MYSLHAYILSHIAAWMLYIYFTNIINVSWVYNLFLSMTLVMKMYYHSDTTVVSCFSWPQNCTVIKIKVHISQSFEAFFRFGLSWIHETPFTLQCWLLSTRGHCWLKQCGGQHAGSCGPTHGYHALELMYIDSIAFLTNIDQLSLHCWSLWLSFSVDPADWAAHLWHLRKTKHRAAFCLPDPRDLIHLFFG